MRTNKISVMRSSSNIYLFDSGCCICLTSSFLLPLWKISVSSGCTCWNATTEWWSTMPRRRNETRSHFMMFWRCNSRYFVNSCRCCLCCQLCEVLISRLSVEATQTTTRSSFAQSYGKRVSQIMDDSWHNTKRVKDMFSPYIKHWPETRKWFISWDYLLGRLN